MNTLFADEVQVAKETSAGSIPFEGAVTRVNALDWRQIGKGLDEQGSALLLSGTASDGANTNTSAIRSCLSFMVSARRSILSSLQSRIAGTKQWEWRCAIQRPTRILSS